MNGGVEASREATFTDLQAAAVNLRELIVEAEHLAHTVKRQVSGSSPIRGHGQGPEAAPETPIRGLIPEMMREISLMRDTMESTISTLQNITNKLDDGRDTPHVS